MSSAIKYLCLFILLLGTCVGNAIPSTEDYSINLLYVPFIVKIGYCGDCPQTSKWFVSLSLSTLLEGCCNSQGSCATTILDCAYFGNNTVKDATDKCGNSTCINGCCINGVCGTVDQCQGTASDSEACISKCNQLGFCVAEDFCAANALKVWNWSFSITIAGTVILGLVLYFVERRRVRSVPGFLGQPLLGDSQVRKKSELTKASGDTLFAELTKSSFA